MVKPIRIFLIILLLLGVLSVLSMLRPPDGWHLAGYKIRYPTLLELLGIDTTENRGVNFSIDPELTRLDFLMDSIGNLLAQDATLVPPAAHDTTFHEDSITLEHQQPALNSQVDISADILRNRLIAIEYPDSSLEALAPFFRALASQPKSKGVVRVMHYGDSQIEGDRITSFLRRRLQNRFGGRGVGLLHAVPHSHQPTHVSQSNSNSWNKVLISEMERGGVGHRFGILGGYSYYSSPKQIPTRGGFSEGWIRFQRSGSASHSGRNFSRIKFMYGFNTEPFLISLQYGGQTHEAEMMPPTQAVKALVWETPLDVGTFQIDIKGDASPMVFGISLESNTGIVVDNIPLRGSTGNDFTRSDGGVLSNALGLLSPKLIILQFGVNVVPHIVESYKYYENQMYEQIRALRTASPKSAIILIGVSDMSRKEGTRFVSYPNIDRIRDAQRNAALRGGAAFWDCFRAMGGTNSMPGWVFANPPLAARDFIHFTHRGSNLLAEMFYASLMRDYERYLAEDQTR